MQGLSGNRRDISIAVPEVPEEHLRSEEHAGQFISAGRHRRAGSTLECRVKGKKECRAERRKITGVISIMLALLVCICLTGCRESFVIEKIIYDQTAEIIDKNHSKLIENNENSNEEDQDLEKKKDSDDSKRKQEERRVAQTKGEQKNPGKAPKAVADPDAKKKDDSLTQGSQNDDNSRNSNNKKGDGDGGKNEGSSGASDDPNSRQVTDGNGNTVTLPEDVNSVVAASSASGIVQMLGGKNILAGTSAAFAQDPLAIEVFGAEGVPETPQFWDGEGTTPMSDAAFQDLLAMKPDVCIGVTGETNFSDSQISKLKKKKIAYVTLPRLNTDTNIKNAVTICGKLLGNRSKQDGGVNAKSLAKQYVEYSDKLLSRVSSRTGIFTWDKLDFNNDVNINGEKHIKHASSRGKYTLYVSAWDAGTYTRKDGGSVIYRDDTGIAEVPQGYSNSPMSYYMSMAGVCNNAARMKKNNYAYYAAIPFALNVANNSISGSSLTIYPVHSENFARAWNNGGIDVGLGESDFPAIVVDSYATMEGILYSPSWESYGRQNVNGIHEYGPVGDNGDIITSYIRDTYDIYVNPAGISRWSEGSPESVLESIWAAYQIRGEFSRSEVKSEIKNFYKKFYRYDLSSSQVDYILQGR